MAKRSKVQFGNIRLKWALLRFGDRVLDQVREIVQDTGLIIYNQAVSLAPVSEVDGGNLKNSISFHSSLDGLTCTVTVGANYALYVEFGTGIYAEKGNGRKDPWVYWSDKLNRWVWTRGMEAQPFWFPSIDNGRKHFKTEMRKLG
ncbi:HK97-gp10 family putative phage morphogenesis protein [Terribacillus saccharophilus]|jgi:HK97 gp10 family phage protein|uniref:HK97-gp10 family putative phage morphogenesis protein n=1 Tax=Terribacillus saccharophilus TaxID=361277 RepID=UPI00380F3CEF